MKQIIIGHLEQLKDHASGQLVDTQIWLKDFECNGQSKIDAENLAKEAESRIKELNDCINFLNGEDLKRDEKLVCDCQFSGNCRYEVIMHDKQNECRHKSSN